MNEYGNRGMTFEEFIEYANRRYRTDGTAIITKQHTLCKPLRDRYSGRIYTAKYEEKATVDFMGRYFERPIAFEAKHTKDEKIDLKRVEEHQCDFLRDWVQEPGAIGFIFVSFQLRDFYLIPWDYWKAAKEAREKKQGAPFQGLPADTMPEWNTTGKASIRRDELPEELRVTVGGSAGLDYLSTVRRLWRM